MGLKTKWTIQEDQFLRNIVTQQGKKNWVQVSRLLHENFGEKKWTAKQCRQRYINCYSNLLSIRNQTEWSKNQMEKMLQLFLIQGPKWKKLAQLMQNRSQNNIKNKFYSTLRKFVRKLNNIGCILNKYKKSLKYSSIARVLKISRSSSLVNKDQNSCSESLRSQIISSITNQNISIQSLKELAAKINTFNLKTRSFKCLKTQNKAVFKQRNSGSCQINQKKLFAQQYHQNALKNKKIEEPKQQNCLSFKQKNEQEIQQQSYIHSIQNIDSNQCHPKQTFHFQLNSLESPLQLSDLL